MSDDSVVCQCGNEITSPVELEFYGWHGVCAECGMAGIEYCGGEE